MDFEKLYNEVQENLNAGRRVFRARGVPVAVQGRGYVWAQLDEENAHLPCGGDTLLGCVIGGVFRPDVFIVPGDSRVGGCL